MDAALEHKRLQGKELEPTDCLSCVKTLTRMFDALAMPQNGVLPDDAEQYPTMIELWFQIALIWAIGGPLAEDEGRCKKWVLLAPQTLCLHATAAHHVRQEACQNVHKAVMLPLPLFVCKYCRGISSRLQSAWLTGWSVK